VGVNADFSYKVPVFSVIEKTL